MSNFVVILKKYMCVCDSDIREHILDVIFTQHAVSLLLNTKWKHMDDTIYDTMYWRTNLKVNYIDESSFDLVFSNSMIAFSRFFR